MRKLFFLLMLSIHSMAWPNQALHGADDYYALLKQLELPTTSRHEQERRLRAYLMRSWPDQDNYAPTKKVRTLEERQAFLQAIQRLTRDRLAAAGDPVTGSDAFERATFALFWNSGRQQPLAHRALVLALDGRLDEADVWQLVTLRLRNGSSPAAFADLLHLFKPPATLWTPEAQAVFYLVNQGPVSVLGIQRLLARYQVEALPAETSESRGPRMRLALPIQGLYPRKVENLLALIEGQHLWRARGRDDLAAEARERALQLAASLSVQMSGNISKDVAQALAAAVHYVATAQQLEPAVYWPEGKLSDWDSTKSEHIAPASQRWVRASTAEDTSSTPEGGRLTRRIGSNDERWWPAFQESYLDLAYRGLPELLRRRLAEPGTLDVFRVWHAGAEDGSQTFLLAALLDEAVALLSSHPNAGGLASELENLRIEIIATDYAYMPDRQGQTYKFDASGKIGDIHHKWNLIAQEIASAPMKANTSAPKRLLSNERLRIHQELGSARSLRERGAVLRSLADAGRIGELLGQIFELAPEVDVPSGEWIRKHPAGAAKHRYRFIDQQWRVVELHADAAPELVNPGSNSRLIRFEKGDMTRGLPSGFEGGNAFDLSVVTGVLPYIYGYYQQQGEKNWRERNAGKGAGNRLTPMEQAQRLLAKGSRAGAWIIMDRDTERAALAARGLAHAMDSNYDSWSDSWVRWVATTLPARQIEVHLTGGYGVERLQASRYIDEPNSH